MKVNVIVSAILFSVLFTAIVPMHAQFKPINSTLFPSMNSATMISGDVNADGSLDLLLLGQDAMYNEVSQLYINDGKGTYGVAKNIQLEGVELGAAAFTDVQNNGYHDLLLTGLNKAGFPIAYLYKNDSQGNFTKTDTAIEGVYYSAVAFEDVNKDGFQDFILSGLNEEFKPITKLYINTGDGQFLAADASTFEGVYDGNIHFVNLTDSPTQDVVISGKNQQGEWITKLYENDGSGKFTAKESFINSIEARNIAFSDVDNDGDLDVIITAKYNQVETNVMLNDGKGNFKAATHSNFSTLGFSNMAIGHFTNHGDASEMILSGENASGNKVIQLYTNDGKGQFELAKEPLLPITNASLLGVVACNEYQDIFVLANTSSIPTILHYRK